MTETYYYNSKNIVDVGTFNSASIVTCNLTVPGILIANSSLSNQSKGFTILYDQVNTACVNLTNGIKVNNNFGTNGYVLTSTSNGSIWDVPKTLWTSSSNSAYTTTSNIYYMCNVGIGLTNPQTSLDIFGSSRFTLNTNQLYNTPLPSNLLTGIRTNYNFGYSISLNYNGTVVIVGSYSNNGNSTTIFRYNSITSNWQSPEYLSNPNSNYNFGYSVALSGDGNTAIASSLLSANSNLNGTVGVYQYINNVWSDPTILTNIYNNSNAQFGNKVGLSLDGYTAVVNAPYSNTFGQYILVYKYNIYNNQWSTPISLVPNIPSILNNVSYGASFDINANGSIICIGASGYSNYTGLISVFSQITNTSNTSNTSNIWTSNILPYPPSVFFTGFSTSLAISGNGNTILSSCAVGSYNSGPYVYTYNSNTNNWNVPIKLISILDFTTNISIDYTGATIIFSTPATNWYNGFAYGKTYIYKNILNKWCLLFNIYHSAPSTDTTALRTKLSGNGNILLYSSYSYLSYTGFASIYDLTPTITINNSKSSLLYYNNSLINTGNLINYGNGEFGNKDGASVINKFYTNGAFFSASSNIIRNESSGFAVTGIAYSEWITYYSSSLYTGTYLTSYDGGNSVNRMTLVCNPLYLSSYTTNGSLSVINNNGQVSSSSDIRLKSNVDYINYDATSKILLLKPVTYEFKESLGTKHIGFIAQDVEKIIPEAVDGKKYDYEWQTNSNNEPIFDNTSNIILTDKPRYRGLDDRAIIALLVKSIQELENRIRILESSNISIVSSNVNI